MPAVTDAGRRREACEWIFLIFTITKDTLSGPEKHGKLCLVLCGLIGEHQSAHYKRLIGCNYLVLHLRETQSEEEVAMEAVP